MNPKSQDVVKQAIKGVALAQRNYENLSNGDWLVGCEYVATTTIAQQVRKLPDVAAVTVENNVGSAIKDAGGSNKGRPNKKLPLQGRFDIAVWNKSSPRGLIEVKTSVWGYSNLKKDVFKLCTALDKAKSIKWAQIAYFMECGSSTTATAENWINVYTDRIEKQASEHISQLGKKVTLHRSKVRVQDDWAWTAAVLEIVRR